MAGTPTSDQAYSAMMVGMLARNIGVNRNGGNPESFSSFAEAMDKVASDNPGGDFGDRLTQLNRALDMQNFSELPPERRAVALANAFAGLPKDNLTRDLRTTLTNSANLMPQNSPERRVMTEFSTAQSTTPVVPPPLTPLDPPQPLQPPADALAPRQQQVREIAGVFGIDQENLGNDSQFMTRMLSLPPAALTAFHQETLRRQREADGGNLMQGDGSMAHGAYIASRAAAVQAGGTAGPIVDSAFEAAERNRATSEIAMMTGRTGPQRDALRANLSQIPLAQLTAFATELEDRYKQNGRSPLTGQALTDGVAAATTAATLKTVPTETGVDVSVPAPNANAIRDRFNTALQAGGLGRDYSAYTGTAPTADLPPGTSTNTQHEVAAYRTAAANDIVRTYLGINGEQANAMERELNRSPVDPRGRLSGDQLAAFHDSLQRDYANNHNQPLTGDLRTRSVQRAMTAARGVGGQTVDTETGVAVTTPGSQADTTTRTLTAALKEGGIELPAATTPPTPAVAVAPPPAVTPPQAPAAPRTTVAVAPAPVRTQPARPATVAPRRPPETRGGQPVHTATRSLTPAETRVQGAGLAGAVTQAVTPVQLPGTAVGRATLNINGTRVDSTVTMTPDRRPSAYSLGDQNGLTEDQMIAELRRRGVSRAHANRMLEANYQPGGSQEGRLSAADAGNGMVRDAYANREAAQRRAALAAQQGAPAPQPGVPVAQAAPPPDRNQPSGRGAYGGLVPPGLQANRGGPPQQGVMAPPPAWIGGMPYATNHNGQFGGWTYAHGGPAYGGRSPSFVASLRSALTPTVNGGGGISFALNGGPLNTVHFNRGARFGFHG